MTFSPGDYVEAVENNDSDGVKIASGQIYCVEVVEPEMWREYECSHGPDCRGDGVGLVSPALPDHQLWCSTVFRPVYRPKKSLFKKLLQPINDKVSS